MRYRIAAAALACGLLGLLGLPVAATAQAPAPSASAPREPMSPEAEARMRTLSEELRCLVCQNQTLADSDADLAVDLRRQVEGMVAAGKSDDEIKDYLVERYGDFVLYRPRFQWNTAVLWAGPFLLLLIGATAWVVVQRRSRRTPEGIQPLSADARERARKLLDD